MNQSSIHNEYNRNQVIQVLSQERGRSSDHPLHRTLISRWCADLGFPVNLLYFNEDQLLQLRAMNFHYARGGTRKELLQKMRNPQWYRSKN